MSEKRFLDKNAILANKPKTDTVEIPEWGEGAAVRVRQIGAADALRIRQFSGPEQNARIAALVMIDEEGRTMFDQDNPEDIEFLSRTRANIIDRICLAAMNLNGISEEEIRTAIKNSEASPSTDSVSG